jgi:hypothetical protein
MLELIATLLLLGIPSSPMAAAATLKYVAPAGWVSKPPGSTMRVAEFTLAKVGGDKDDAVVAVYFLGAGGGGGAQANIDRWVSQMSQPDGTSSKALAKTSTLTVHGLTISEVDVSGTFVAEMSPGSAERFNYPGWRLRAAVIEAPGAIYYVKLTGPAATVAKWSPSFDDFLKSTRYE